MQFAYHKIADDLLAKGFSIIDNFFSPALLESLAIELERLQQMQALDLAKIGRGDNEQLRTSVRSDLTCWLSSENNTSEKEYLGLLEEMRMGLNKELLMALFYFEAHYAFYPIGAFYKKHFDSFKGAKSRIISMVTYLNHNWREADGGLLNLYGEHGEVISSILPEFGRMVIFLSEEMEHEVTVANRERKSIASWFRCREV